MKVANKPIEKTVSLDSRNRVVLPSPAAREYIMTQNADGSIHLVPAVPIAADTIKRIGKAIKALKSGKVGKEVSVKELDELSALLAKQGF
jgi:hypothetical protein